MKSISNRQKPAWLPTRKSGRKITVQPAVSRPGWKKKTAQGKKPGS